MTDLLADPTAATTAAPAAEETDDHELVEEELLVEDVSIDGMCGVY
jgi:mycofactocin precursor